jgi:hypothetical protein
MFSDHPHGIPPTQIRGQFQSTAHTLKLLHVPPVCAARAAVGDDAAFDCASQEGHAMTLEQAIEYVLEEHDA